MASIGEFGAARREVEASDERDTLTLCGVEFTVADAIDPLAVLEFGEVAASGVDGESPEGMKAMLALIRNAVDESEWPRFRTVIRQHRPSIEVLMELSMAVIQRATGRPTERPSDSSDGSSPTGASSKAPSSSAASSTPATWRDTPFGRREIQAHPDLYADVVPLNSAGQSALAG